MNTHVPPPGAREPGSLNAGIAEKDRDTANRDARARRPARRPPAEAKSPPDTCPDRPRSRKADAARPDTSQPPPEEPTPFERAYWTRPRLTAAAIAGAAVVGAILWWSPGTDEPKITYTVAKVSLGTVTVSIAATGTLAPRDPVDVVAPSGGRIESVAVKSGDRVVKGQMLARLTSEASQDDLARAQALLVPRQADVARAEADVAEERASVLRERDGKVPGQYEAAQTRLARALADATESRALLREAQDRVTAARERIANLDVRAPFDGIVLTSNLEPGNNVGIAARGEKLFTLVAGLSQLDLMADIPESAVGGLHIGEEARFTVPAFAQRSFPAVLTALDLWPKKTNGTGKEVASYSATLAAGNPGGALRPGMSANVAIIVSEAKNVLTVPNAALALTPPKAEAKFPPPPKVSSAGVHPARVWVMVNDKPEPRDIAVGLSDGRITQVVSGPLRAGESVIVNSFVEARGGKA